MLVSSFESTGKRRDASGGIAQFGDPGDKHAELVSPEITGTQARKK
jgi:hypothetical protein